MKYKLKDGVSFNLINKESIIKFDFDLSDYYKKQEYLNFLKDM